MYKHLPICVVEIRFRYTLKLRGMSVYFYSVRVKFVDFVFCFFNYFAFYFVNFC